jgi:hypothetical protein
MPMSNRSYSLIAEFHGGPYDGQRREMRYLQTEWHPDTGLPQAERRNAAGYYARTQEMAADQTAYVWVWRADK